MPQSAPLDSSANDGTRNPPTANKMLSKKGTYKTTESSGVGAGVKREVSPADDKCFPLVAQCMRISGCNAPFFM